MCRLFNTTYLPVRIGLHLGEVVMKEGNIFGHTVNIASRIESVATAGTILFSQQVRAIIKNQPTFLRHNYLETFN